MCLVFQLEKLGNPGGGTLYQRNGRIFAFHDAYLVTSWTYEYLEQGVVRPALSKEEERNMTDWVIDVNLPLNLICSHEDFKNRETGKQTDESRKNGKQINGNRIPEDYQMAHLSQDLNHQHDERELRDARLMSNCCLQHKLVNEKAIGGVEKFTQAVNPLFNAHIFTGTVVR